MMAAAPVRDYYSYNNKQEINTHCLVRLSNKKKQNWNMIWVKISTTSELDNLHHDV